MKKKWTKKEIIKLKELSKIKTFRDIYLCGRTYNAIRLMAIKLKIKSIYKPEEETKKLETRNKIANTLKRLGLRPPSPLGRIASLETKRKMSEAHKREKCWNWKGGIIPIEDDIYDYIVMGQLLEHIDLLKPYGRYETEVLRTLRIAEL